MAITRLSDLIQRTAFQKAALLESIHRSALFDSGIIQQDADLARLLALNAGKTFTFEYFDDLADSTPNQSTDNPADVATANKITTATNTAQKIMRNNGWGVANLTANLSTTGDALTAIAGRIGAYWGRHYDATTIAVVRGLIADNIASNSGDMIHDISGVANGQKITFESLADTAQTMGDAKDQLKVLVMHSSQATVLLKDQVTNKVFDASGNLLYQEILGYRIVISDNVYSNAGVYDSYLFKPGAIAFANGVPKKPEEVEVAPSAGNGEGTETLWSRRHFCLHPYGFDFEAGSVAGLSATNAELALAANWARKYERKRVGLAVLRSKNSSAP